MIFVVRMSFIKYQWIIECEYEYPYILIILIALSSRESEFQNLYVSSEKKIENVYLCQF